MDDTNNQLLELRQQAVDASTPLLDDQNLDPERRFTMALHIAQATPSLEALRRTYQLALEISDSTKRADALMDVIDEIDLLIEVNAEEATEIDNNIQ